MTEIKKKLLTCKKFLDNNLLSKEEILLLKKYESPEKINKVTSLLRPPPPQKTKLKYGFIGPEKFTDKDYNQLYPDELLYWFVPEKYSGEPFALLVFMHGGDKNSPKTAPEGYLRKNKPLRLHIENAPFITVAPSAPSGANGSRWNQRDVSKYLVAVIEETCRRYNINRDRIFLAGHSMGGFGAYHNSQLLDSRLAGALLSAGAWRIMNPKAFSGVPVYILHGKYDCAAAYREFHKTPRHHSWCGVSYARAAHYLLKRDFINHQYDEHEGGHGLIWEPAQLAFIRFMEWAEPLQRNRALSRVCAVTPRGSGQFCLEDAKHCHWITINKIGNGKIAYDKIVLNGPETAWRVEDLAQQKYELKKVFRRGGIVDAKNIGNNCFEINTENIKSFSIWLNPEMIDFMKPVEICLNGNKITKQAIPSLYDVLRSYQRFNDWSNISWAEITV